MTELAKEYATGLFELAQSENMDEDMLSELLALSGCLHEQPDFCRLLGNMSISKSERVQIIDQTLRAQVHPYLLNFMKILCERGALGEFDDCVRAYRDLYDKAHGVMEAVVTTSKPLDEKQRVRMIEKLSSVTGRQIRLREQVDESVIDGVLLEMGGKRYDNTVREHLRSIRSAMNAEG